MSTADKIRTLRADRAQIDQQIDRLTTAAGVAPTPEQQARIRSLEELRDSKARDIQTLLST